MHVIAEADRLREADLADALSGGDYAASKAMRSGLCGL